MSEREPGSARLRRNMVLKALREHGALSERDLVTAVEVPITEIQLRGVLNRLWVRGRVERTEEGYRLVQS